MGDGMPESLKGRKIIQGENLSKKIIKFNLYKKYHHNKLLHTISGLPPIIKMKKKTLSFSEFPKNVKKCLNVWVTTINGSTLRLPIL